MRIGLTTTVPVEIVYAAGHTPVDLNNLFISHPDPPQLVEEAELAGFPRNFCAWVKGIYGAVKLCGGIDALLAVTQGDCSNTKALMETLEAEGVEVIPFAYPYEPDRLFLQGEMEKLMRRLGAGWEEVREAERWLDGVRRLVWEMDRLCWEEGRVSGAEAHLFQVSCSDMEGDPEAFAAKVEAALERAGSRASWVSEGGVPIGVRLGYAGVPPIAPEMFGFLEELGVRVVFHEVQRQFTLPREGEEDLVGRYLAFTYPYSVFRRLRDIGVQARRRGISGIIHYVQSFCFRQVEDILLRRRLDLPLLTLEMDRSNRLDARTRMRLESFAEMLRQGK
jgi:benzoyl-CoA reductase/2-hydroxyglutaryl-CoA dehydratase subunit BcrC/BadD/HgdB